MTDRLLFVLAALSAVGLVGWRAIPDAPTATRLKPPSEIGRVTPPSSPAVRFKRHTSAGKKGGTCAVDVEAMDISYQTIGGATFYAYANGELVGSGTTNDTDVEIDNLDCSATVTIYTDDSLLPTGHALVQGDWCPGVTWYDNNYYATAQITFSGDGDMEQSTFCVH